MKLTVALKQVPTRDSALRVNPTGNWIDETDLGFEINEPDAYALEAALVLREKVGGEVTVLCAGPERAASSIREALAKGADRAVHVVCEPAALDSFEIASRLAAVLAEEKPDLVLTGLQSDDLGFGQTGVLIAELLGIPHVTIVMEIETLDRSIRVKRELEAGWFQWVQLPMPALITIQSGINKLRYATLMGIKKAKTKEIRRVTESETFPVGRPVSLQRVYAPSRRKEAHMIAGGPAEAAAKLAEILKSEVRVI